MIDARPQHFVVPERPRSGKSRIAQIETVGHGRPPGGIKTKARDVAVWDLPSPSGRGFVELDGRNPAAGGSFGRIRFTDPAAAVEVSPNPHSKIKRTTIGTTTDVAIAFSAMAMPAKSPAVGFTS